MLDRGYLTVGRFRGAPIRLHWSMPLGALLFGGFRFEPVFWVAFLGLVLVHELGHAVVVRRLGQHVLSVDVTGFGGMCRWTGQASTYDRARIAWGGVLAQGVLLLVALVVAWSTPAAHTRVGAQLLAAFIDTNLVLMALNLLPFRPLDGAQAWPLLPQLLARWRGHRILRGLGRRPRVRSPRPKAERSRPAGAAQSRELADFLKQVSEEAREARRGGRSGS